MDGKADKAGAEGGDKKKPTNIPIVTVYSIACVRMCTSGRTGQKPPTWLGVGGLLVALWVSDGCEFG